MARIFQSQPGNQLISLNQEHMKRKTSLLFALPFMLLACNNEAKDSVEKADSANESKMDSTAGNTITTDEETTNFLVKAANGGMAEVKLGELAQQKATTPKVKDYGAMLAHDHSAANDQVKTFAAQRNVTLPGMVGEDKQKVIDDLSKKTGKDFDRAYIKEMVDDHEKDIRMFEDASGKVNDAEVKTFVDNTLPKLRNHLDSAKAIQKMLK
jgi:putative membrane protein